MTLRQGSIIRVENVLDERGENPKPRRMILITPTDQIATVKELVFVCISSRFDEPLPPDCIKLPYSNGRPHPMTRLSLESVAICRWQHVLPASGSLPVPIGFCPLAVLKQILDRLQPISE